VCARTACRAWQGLIHCARHTTGRDSSQETRARNAFDDAANTTHESLEHGDLPEQGAVPAGAGPGAGRVRRRAAAHAGAHGGGGGRGLLHSSTFRLNATTIYALRWVVSV